ncbi:hypothetical protein [Nostoc sp. C052]|nr:hypothetical protein [Nostoc sp. C052]
MTIILQLLVSAIAIVSKITDAVKIFQVLKSGKVSLVLKTN